MSNAIETADVEGHTRTTAPPVIAAPPVDGKANAEVERYLAELLNLPRSAVTVVRGAGSRDKAVKIQSLHPDEVREALSRYLD